MPSTYLWWTYGTKISRLRAKAAQLHTQRQNTIHPARILTTQNTSTLTLTLDRSIEKALSRNTNLRIPLLNDYLGWGAVSDLSLIADLSQEYKHDLWRLKSELKLSQIQQHVTKIDRSIELIGRLWFAPWTTSPRSMASCLAVQTSSFFNHIPLYKEWGFANKVKCRYNCVEFVTILHTTLR